MKQMYILAARYDAEKLLSAVLLFGSPGNRYDEGYYKIDISDDIRVSPVAGFSDTYEADCSIPLKAFKVTAVLYVSGAWKEFPDLSYTAYSNWPEAMNKMGYINTHDGDGYLTYKEAGKLENARRQARFMQSMWSDRSGEG